MHMCRSSREGLSRTCRPHCKKEIAKWNFLFIFTCAVAHSNSTTIFPSSALLRNVAHISVFLRQLLLYLFVCLFSVVVLIGKWPVCL